jgi:hypothetical protein
MDEEKPRKRRTTKFIRSARTTRILERLREGIGRDEIGRQEKRTERRVRRIVAEAQRFLPAVIPAKAGIQSHGAGRTPSLSRPQPGALGLDPGAASDRKTPSGVTPATLISPISH